MEEQINKSYYAIIPADVRYDKNLTANAKLLYAEITALTNEKGYCWASNSYFAELYGVSKRSISAWIKNLEEQGYIYTKNIYEEGSKNIKYRYIYLNNSPNTYREKLPGVVKETSDPSEENFMRVMKKSSDPSEENFAENNKYNNTFNNNYPPISPQGENGEVESENKISDLDASTSERKEEVKEDTPQEKANRIINSISKDKDIKKVIKEFAGEDIDLIDALREFYKARSKLKKPLTARALKLNIRALKELSTDRDEQIEIINQSIEKGWQSFYELPKDHPYQRKKSMKENAKYGYVF